MIRRSPRCGITASLLVAALAGSATAETEVFSGTMQVDEGISLTEIPVPRFDSQDGERQLVSVQLSLRSEVIGELITNGSGIPVAYEIRHAAGWSLKGSPLGATDAAVAGVAPNETAIAAFFFGSDELPVTIDAAGELAAWTGDGERLIAADSQFTITADPPNEIEIPAAGGLRWELTYTWQPDLLPCPGDVDGDGEVALGDLLVLLASWGPCGDPCPADLVPDGTVDINDLLAALSNWGPCPRP